MTGLHTLSSAVALLDPIAVERFIETARRVAPRLVILDTLARCLVGGDENSAKDMGLAVSAMDRIRVALDATVLAIHHTNKSESSERGSGALRGACDALWFLTQADDLLQLSCEKFKDRERFEPIDLKLVPAYEGASTCIVQLAQDVAPAGRLTDNQGKALHVLAEMFGEAGATWKEWSDALPMMSPATRYRVRKTLTDQGHVRQGRDRFYPAFSRPLTSFSTSSGRTSQEAA
jgi:hypothetical protein